MSTRTVTLSEEDLAAIQRLIKRGEIPDNIEEYLSNLIALDVLSRGGGLEGHEALVLEALEKGKYTPGDASYFERLREGIRARAKGKASA
jgi:hypothetical protein